MGKSMDALFDIKQGSECLNPIRYKGFEFKMELLNETAPSALPLRHSGCSPGAPLHLNFVQVSHSGEGSLLDSRAPTPALR
jgi:hypothetical protein